MTDPVMNPAAPSGRRDDSSLASDGERFSLPAGTRTYVDTSGAKHFILPDGTSRYVPPGEVGNFFIEGEDPQMALRRYLIQKLPYVDAVSVNGMLDNLFGAMNSARGIGAGLKIVPLNAEEDPDFAALLDRAYNNPEPAQYPKAKYHESGEYRAVKDEDEEGELGDGWHDHPDDAKKAKDGGRDDGWPYGVSGDPRVQENDPAASYARQRSQNDGQDGEGGFSDTGGVIKPDVAKGDQPAPVA